MEFLDGTFCLKTLIAQIHHAYIEMWCCSLLDVQGAHCEHVGTPAFMLACLVAGFLVSTLISYAHHLRHSSTWQMASYMWRHKVSLLLDCLTCASMVLSKLF